MQGKITRISVTWAEPTGHRTRFRFYNVLPDDEKIIRPERMEDLLDDLTAHLPADTGRARPHAQRHAITGP